MDSCISGLLRLRYSVRMVDIRNAVCDDDTNVGDPRPVATCGGEHVCPHGAYATCGVGTAIVVRHSLYSAQQFSSGFIAIQVKLDIDLYQKILKLVTYFIIAF